MKGKKYILDSNNILSHSREERAHKKTEKPDLKVNGESRGNEVNLKKNEG